MTMCLAVDSVVKWVEHRYTGGLTLSPLEVSSKKTVLSLAFSSRLFKSPGFYYPQATAEVVIVIAVSGAGSQFTVLTRLAPLSTPW